MSGELYMDLLDFRQLGKEAKPILSSINARQGNVTTPVTVSGIVAEGNCSSMEDAA
jgi:hypothetical protein